MPPKARKSAQDRVKQEDGLLMALSTLQEGFLDRSMYSAAGIVDIGAVDKNAEYMI